MKLNTNNTTQKRNALRFFMILILMLTMFASLTACKAEKEVNIVLFYTTDAHGHVLSDDDTIGLDVIAAIKRQEQDSLLLDVGDFSHGLPIATLTKGKDVINLMKQAGYDAAAIGNHEFDYGYDVLKQNVQTAETGEIPMNILSANIYKQADSTHAFTPYIIKTVKGVKIGIFGLTTLDTAVQSLPSQIAGLDFKDPVEETAKAVAELKAQKCGIIVALAHVGSEAGVSGQVAAVEGVDIVIDGHSHVVLNEKTEGKAHLVSSGEYGNNVGKIEITHNNKKGILDTANTLIDKAATENTEGDAVVKQALNQIVSEQDEILKEVLTTIPFDLTAEKPIVRTVETNLGSLMADAILFAANADFAIMNGGGIRATLTAGDVTIGDALTVFPYSNLIVAKRITGAQAYEIMEHSVSMLPVADGRFAQIGGFKAVIDATKPAGERIVSLTKSDGTEIIKTETYTLATNSYIADGGDSYPILSDLPVVFQGATEEEVFINYLKICNITDYEFTEGRIAFV